MRSVEQRLKELALLGKFGRIRLPEITVVHLDFPPRSNDNVEVGIERSARVDDTAARAKIKGLDVEFGEPLVIKVFGEQKEKAFDLD